ncbi:hypothetical protein PIB30_098223, partial [Stylosanthes scabra]|nr:hypothetical protein [Stylosanthes scabra]
TITPSQAPLIPTPEQHPPSPQAQSSATTVASTSIRRSPEPSLKDILRYLQGDSDRGGTEVLEESDTES